MVTTVGSGFRNYHLYMVEWREHLNHSVQQIADRVEVSRETIWRWENEQHRLNPEKIAHYAWALGLHPEQLYRPPEPKEKKPQPEPPPNSGAMPVGTRRKSGTDG